jgi:hypothetical protein
MSRRRKSTWPQLEHDLYITQRTMGDARGAQRGPDVLARRLAKRAYHRRLTRMLKRAGLW